MSLSIPSQGSSDTKRDPVLANKTIHFKCQIRCAEHCCSGATLLTGEEIKGLYRLFPITIAFRKYRAINYDHRLLLETVGLNMGGYYIVGDFVAGNWRDKRCVALNENGVCPLHEGSQKPLQCSLVPFCALYPEDLQHLVIEERKAREFSPCRGFKKDGTVVWRSGRFVDDTYKRAFYGYQQALMRQRDFMVRLLKMLKGSEGYNRFLLSEGILESPIPASLQEEFFELIGMQNGMIDDYVKEQGRLVEKQCKKLKGPSVFSDQLVELSRFRCP